MEYFDYETGNGGIGDTQRADIVLNANAVNEQSKAFFREICKKNGRQFVIISGCIFSKEAYAGGVNNISTTEGYIYNKALDSIIKVEAQNIIESGSEWFIFYLKNIVKNDEADGLRSYKDGANVNCWKQERYILKGISTGAPSNTEHAQFTFYMQDELQKYIYNDWTDISADLNNTDYSFGTNGYIKVRNNNGLVELMMYNIETALVDQSAVNIITLTAEYRPLFDYDINTVVKTDGSSLDQKFQIKSNGEVSGSLSINTSCRIMLNWSK